MQEDGRCTITFSVEELQMPCVHLQLSVTVCGCSDSYSKLSVSLHMVVQTTIVNCLCLHVVVQTATVNCL